MNENERMLARRVSALEVNVGKLVQAVTGMAQAVSMAQQMPVQCGECGSDMAGMQSCNVADCPQGFEPLEETGDEDD